MPDGLSARVQAPLLLTTDAVGGVWRYTIDLARGLQRRGVPARIAVVGPAPDADQRREAAGLGVIETGLPLDWTAESPAALARTTAGLRELAIDAHAVHLHAPALAGSARWPVPVVAVAHSCVGTWWEAVRGGPLPADLTWRAEATEAGLHTADAAIAPTRAHAAATRARYPGVVIEAVHNGAACSGPAPRRSRAVLTAGRLWDEGKGAAALDRVAPGLDAPIRAAGPTAGANGAAIALPHLDLLGRLGPDAMARAYAEATVFASMARYEPFGLSVLEAALSGLRLVLADIPTFRELWDGAAIFVAGEADLLPALRDALAQPGDGGAQARARRYTLDAMIDGTLAVHRRLGALV